MKQQQITYENFALFSELPQYPNVDPFNYETMKKMLIEKLDSFAAAPFTIQRISELLSDPRKQYSRIDKFMRAVEKTILVVSTVPPGRNRSESENGDSFDSALNGEFASEVNVDVDMDPEGAFTATKDITVTMQRKEQNSEVTAVSHEIITIKKTVKEDEEGKIDEKGTEASTAVTIENIAVTVIEATKAEAAPESPVTEQVEAVVQAEASVIQEPEVASKIPEPKVDDALLNEPIRSAENEILVDTAEIISETTPLAALENIVAIRTEPLAETVEPIVQEIAETPSVTEAPPVAVVEECSETEAKRLKIEEVSEVATEPPFVVQEVATVAPEVPVEPLIPELVAAPATEQQIEAPVVETSVIQEQIATIPQTEPVVELIVPEKIDEPKPEIAEIPIEIVLPTEDIAETPSTDMETIPTIAENTMSLDEDEPPALEQEMTPVASKMDTDDAEAAPMDFEDDAEPMDQ